MTPSDRCADFIKGFESLRLAAYMPTGHDVPTIGWGSTGADVRMGLEWTREQADARFAMDMRNFGAEVWGLVDHFPTTQGQFDAMVSLAYNIGVKAFQGSTLLRLHRVGNYRAAAAQFARWNLQAGVVLGGLTRRRKAESLMYLSDSPEPRADEGDQP